MIFAVKVKISPVDQDQGDRRGTTISKPVNHPILVYLILIHTHTRMGATATKADILPTVTSEHCTETSILSGTIPMGVPLVRRWCNGLPIRIHAARTPRALSCQGPSKRLRQWVWIPARCCPRQSDPRCLQSDPRRLSERLQCNHRWLWMGWICLGE